MRVRLSFKLGLQWLKHFVRHSVQPSSLKQRLIKTKKKCVFDVIHYEKRNSD